MLNEIRLDDTFGVSESIAAGLTLFLIVFVGVTGNILILFVVVQIMKERQNTPNYLIFIQAVADLTNLVLPTIQPFMTYVTGVYIGGSVACNIHGTVLHFTNSFCVLTLVATVTDRVFAISLPYLYAECNVPSRFRIAVFVSTVMTFSTVFAILPAAGFGRNVPHYPNTYCLFALDDVTSKDKAVVLVNIGLLTTILTVIVGGNCACCYSVYRMINYRHSVHESESSVISDSRERRQEIVFLQLSLFTLTLFVVCWMPFYVSMGDQEP